MVLLVHSKLLSLVLVYIVLEAGKVYLTLEHIPVESGEIHIVSATPADGEAPATIQPYVNEEGELGHTQR